MKKNQLFIAVLVCFFAFACKNAGDTTATTTADTTAVTTTPAEPTMTATTDTTATAFACPMHADITGKDGDKCSKCGMALVMVKKAEPGHEGHNH